MAECWKAAVEDQTVAICEFPRLCAHGTQEAIIKQILNLDLQYNARQPHPHRFLQDPDIHHNHDLCELDTHSLVQESMQQLLNRGLDAPASVLLAMDKKYDRFLLAQMGVFHYTARRETMAMLLSNGMDINQVHPIFGETALISAIKHPDIDDEESVKIVRRLLDHGANIDTVGAEKYSAVILAAKSNKPRTTRLLLSRGAQVPFHFRDFVGRVVEREFGNSCEHATLFGYNW